MFAYNVCMKIFLFWLQGLLTSILSSSCYSSCSKFFSTTWSQLVAIRTECLLTMFAWKSSFFVCKGCWYQFYHHLVTVHVLKVFYKGLNLLLSELNVFLQFLHENLSFLFTRAVDTNFIIILLQLMFQRFFYNMFSTCCSQNWIFASFFVGKGYWYKFWDDLDKKNLKNYDKCSVINTFRGFCHLFSITTCGEFELQNTTDVITTTWAL